MELSTKQHWANGHHFQALLYEQGEGAGKGHRPQMFPRWGVHGSTKHVPFQEILLPTVIMWQVQWQYQDFSGFCHLLSCLAMNPSTDFLARSKVLIDWKGQHRAFGKDRGKVEASEHLRVAADRQHQSDQGKVFRQQVSYLTRIPSYHRLPLENEMWWGSIVGPCMDL